VSCKRLLLAGESGGLALKEADGPFVEIASGGQTAAVGRQGDGVDRAIQGQLGDSAEGFGGPIDVVDEGLAAGGAGGDEAGIAGAGERFDAGADWKAGRAAIAEPFEMPPFPMAKERPLSGAIVVKQALGVEEGIVIDSLGGDADLSPIGSAGGVLFFLAGDLSLGNSGLFGGAESHIAAEEARLGFGELGIGRLVVFLLIFQLGPCQAEIAIDFAEVFVGLVEASIPIGDKEQPASKQQENKGGQ